MIDPRAQRTKLPVAVSFRAKQSPSRGKSRVFLGKPKLKMA
jgi:hypothetical protein